MREAPMKKKATSVTDEELKAMIRASRPVFEAKLASGEIEVRPVTYTRPRGPSIIGGPHGWVKGDPKA